VLFFLLFCVVEFPLSPEIDAVGMMTRYPGGFAVLNARDDVLVLSDEDGNTLGTYDKRGNGPGEFNDILQIRYFDGKFYLLETLEHSVIVLDEALTFLEEFRVDGPIRDLLITAEHCFLVYWHGRSDLMVHQFSRDRAQHLHSYAKSFIDKRMIGFQMGYIQQHEGKILFVHAGMPQIHVIDPLQKQETIVTLPGFERNHDLLDFEGLKHNGGGPYTYLVWDLVAGAEIFLILRDAKQRVAWAYPFDPASLRFAQPQKITPYPKYDKAQTLFQIVERDDLGNDRPHLFLRPIPLEGFDR